MIRPYVRSEHCTTIWTGPQAEKDLVIVSFKKGFGQGHLTCHYLLMDQTDCDPML